jgi:thiamine monophosphate kinase
MMTSIVTAVNKSCFIIAVPFDDRSRLDQPIKTMARRMIAGPRWRLAGDDYQIAFTAAPDHAGPFTRIGRVMAGEGVGLRDGGREIAIPKSGYRHF